MSSYRLTLATGLIAIGILTACNSTGDQPKESVAEKPAAPPVTKQSVLYTGEEAFNRMMGLANKWSPDAQPARLESVITTETTGQNGKSTIWRGYFVSPIRHSTKTIVCSGSRQPDAPPFGVSAEGNEGSYNAASANLAFMPLLLKADTDKAFDLAQQHGGDALLKKNVNQSVMYVLLKDKKQNVPVWYVIYGTSEKDRKGIAIVNATTGDFVSAGK